MRFWKSIRPRGRRPVGVVMAVLAMAAGMAGLSAGPARAAARPAHAAAGARVTPPDPPASSSTAISLVVKGVPEAGIPAYAGTYGVSGTGSAGGTNGGSTFSDPDGVLSHISAATHTSITSGTPSVPTWYGRSDLVSVAGPSLKAGGPPLLTMPELHNFAQCTPPHDLMTDSHVTRPVLVLGQHELIDDGATVTMDVTGQDLGLPDVQSGRLTFTMRTISQRVGVTSAAIRFVITIEGTLTGRDGTQLYTGPLATLTLADVTADCAPGPAKADVQVTKSGPARVNPDGTVTYTLEVLNNGPGTAEDVTVQDPVSADLTDVTTATSGCSVTGTSAKTLDCALGAMADGARREVTFTAKVKPGIGPETVIDNCGTVYTTTEETSEGNNQSCLQTTVEPPPPAVRTDVGVVKQGPGTTTAGGTVTYTVTVTNHGTSEASDVVLGDILGPLGTLAGTPPEGCTTEGRTLTCEIGSLAPGETRTYTVTATVAPGAANGQALTNCASSDTSTPETDETNNESCVQTIVGEQAPTAVTDLSVAKYGSAAITPDGRAVYQLTVTNNSAVDAKDVVISDVLGDFLAVYRVPRLCTLNDRVLTCSVGTLAAGESTTISLTAFPAGNAVLGDLLQNCESAQTTTPESTLENNHSCAATLITDTAVPPRTDVRITKSAPATARPGGPVRYALTVSNPGTHPAEGVVVEDVLADEFSTVAALPAGCALDGRTLTCAVGTLAPGARRTFTITATVRNDAALGSVVENCGVVYPVTLDSATLGSCVSTLLKRVIPIGPAPTGGGFAPSGTGVPAGARAPATAGGLALIAAGALLAAVGRRARRRPGPGPSALPGDEG